MPIDLVSREAWGATTPKGGSYLQSTKGVKVHYTGDHVDEGILADHSKCVATVRAIQSHHMNGNGWSDVGYTMMVCPHRKVFMGRGPHVLPSANGPGHNSGHYAVLGLVGNSGFTEPNDEMLHGIRDAIEYLREKGNAGSEIKGHRDGYSTDCPGSFLYKWVKAGAPRPKLAKPPTVPSVVGKETMPEFVSLALENKKIQVFPGKWTDLVFNKELSDTGKQHSDNSGPSFLTGLAHYVCQVGIRFSEMPARVEGQIRLVEVDKVSEVPTRYHDISEWHGTAGDTFVEHLDVGVVSAGNKLRCSVTQFGDNPVGIVACTVNVLYWR